MWTVVLYVGMYVECGTMCRCLLCSWTGLIYNQYYIQYHLHRLYVHCICVYK